jgi:hypothetical protein
MYECVVFLLPLEVSSSPPVPLHNHKLPNLPPQAYKVLLMDLPAAKRTLHWEEVAERYERGDTAGVAAWVAAALAGARSVGRGT